MRARQVRRTTYIEVAIRTLPPKAKNDGRGVQRPQAAERKVGEVEIEHRKSQLKRDP
jgi:hypothetical protein